MMPEDLTNAPESSEGLSEMSDEQFAVFAATVANVAAALDQVPADLARRMRAQQEDVAETRRRAQVNEDLLRLRVR